MVYSSKKYLDDQMFVKGYQVPKNTGMLLSYPKYSIPKDKSSNFLDKIKRVSTSLPGPHHYQPKSTWNVS